MPSTPARELASIDFEAMLGGPLVAVVNAQAQAAMSSVNFIKAVGFRARLDDDGNPVPGEVGDPIYVSFTYPKEVAPYRPGTDPAVVAINVTDGGSGYSSPPVVTIADAPSGGRTARAHAELSGDKVSKILIDDPGSGYTAAPNVTVAAPDGTGGTTAKATANWVDGTEPVAAVFADMTLQVPILTMLPIPFIRIEETTIDFNAKINSVVEAKTDSSFNINSDLEVKGQYPPLFSAVTAKLKVSTSYQKNTQSGYKVDRTYSMAVHIRATQDELPAGMERVLGILEDAIVSKPAAPQA